MRELLGRTIKRWWFLGVEVVLAVIGGVQLATDFAIPGWVWPILLAAPLVVAQFLTAMDIARERDAARQVSGDDAARREIRTTLAAFRVEADNLIRAALSAQDLYWQTQPFTMDFDAQAHWQDEVRRYLRETSELGEEYVHRFNELIETGIKQVVSFPDRFEDHILRLREMKRRLEVFRQEFA